MILFIQKRLLECTELFRTKKLKKVQYKCGTYVFEWNRPWMMLGHLLVEVLVKVCSFPICSWAQMC